jgi:hypothetical protein
VVFSGDSNPICACALRQRISPSSAPNLAPRAVLDSEIAIMLQRFCLRTDLTDIRCSFQTTTDLGVAFAPEIMSGCMIRPKDENLVSGGAAVPEAARMLVPRTEERGNL